jgi:prolyl-tRNA editing enzyme YbaK/EbsC (Cys-tRNA(Pro) deacylase)
MLGPLDVHRHLLSRDIAHEIIRLRRVAPTADHLPDALGLPPYRCVIARVYQAHAGSTPFLAVVLCSAGYEPDLRVLRDVLGTPSVAAAEADAVNAQTGYLAGHVAPALLPEDAIVCVAEEITRLDEEVVYTATGDGGTVLAIHLRDLLQLCGSRVVVPAAAAVPAPAVVALRPAAQEVPPLRIA